MHYSALLVTTRPRDTHRCRSALLMIRGIEVHRTDPSTGRILVVQEGETVEQQQAGMTEIRCLPEVARVDLVYHYVESEPESGEPGFSENTPGAMS